MYLNLTHNVRGLRLNLLDGEGDGAIEDVAIEVDVQLQEDIRHLSLI